ncbi:LLM class flavin-dependent oxidoreductase [Nonomuraea jabiensis]|uniref:Alkanesulfonate monooxygenase n=1 Tax=Nonomuraea jabiensis TaxID=882448 RepID=A0A7W9GGG0_9ACTN|nr:LLM class flavin-dependent oxidoreductase [Nonomuraea jabiensis]MBB5783241.1 alkanesulfonate monooxygenase [Nonomuraea jabiensis]
MTVKFHWYLPTHGDTRALWHQNRTRAEGKEDGEAVGYRPFGLGYMNQIALAAEDLGFEAVLTPTGSHCEDAWLSTVAIAQYARRLKFLVAFRPGLISPTLAAQQAATFQHLTGGRLLLNVVSGGSDAEQRRYGDGLAKADRYRRTEEFLTILRGIWKGAPYDFEGDHYEVRDAVLPEPPDSQPALYFGGSSQEALGVAGRQADVYLAWAEPPDQLAATFDEVRAHARAAGREIRFGIRLHTIARSTSEAAWAQAQSLLDALDEDTVRAAQEKLRARASEGQRRMLSLNEGVLGRARDLEVHPGLWAGPGLVRAGAGTSFVGSYAEVARLVAEYAEIGVSEFILSGYPQLEELYWFGEGVLPELRRAGLWGRDLAHA